MACAHDGCGDSPGVDGLCYFHRKRQSGLLESPDASHVPAPKFDVGRHHQPDLKRRRERTKYDAVFPVVAGLPLEVMVAEARDRALSAGLRDVTDEVEVGWFTIGITESSPGGRSRGVVSTAAATTIVIVSVPGTARQETVVGG